MNIPGALNELIAEGRVLRPAGEGIYSALDDAPREHLYDRRARAYDAIVSTWIYNRLMWGASPRDYEAFARRAVNSQVEGIILDAGCGSLLFTARAHTEAGRPVVAFDQSLRMLERARARLVKLAGRVPDHITLLQADIGDLPFRPAAFRTVLCMNVLHHCPDAAAVFTSLDNLLDESGQLFLTTLVTNGRTVGDAFLGALFRAGDLARPRSRAELERILNSHCRRGVEFSARGNMTYAVTRPPA